jgi:hypothetical protein
MRRPSKKRWSARAQLALAGGLILVLGFLPTAAFGAAAPPPGGHSQEDFAADDFYYDHHDQHGPSSDHLPGSVDNVDLVGKLKLTNQVGDISDVSAMATTSDGTWYAYVGDWGAKCQSGGVHVVDFSDPANPVKVGFLNAGGTGYQTEGIQALHIATTTYTGDILVVSNEWCLAKKNPKLNPGGITIYDIDDPTNPVTLVDDFGDFGVHGNRANESHSVIAWDAGDGNAYAAAIDNEEVEDVDLFEITDPTNPVLVAETELPGVNVNGHGELKTSHDFDVLQFPDGTWHLMVSDWDAGWIDVDVTDPSNPTIVGDFDYAACDQLITTVCPPEGNAHQGEWNSDGSVFVGTDEDFDSFRTSDLTRTTGDANFPAPESYTTVGVGGAPVTILEDKRLNGPVAYGGYGCPGTSDPIPNADATIPPESLAPGEEQIIVLQRGPGATGGVPDDPDNPEEACFPGEKADNATDQGWDAVILTGRHVAGGASDDDPPNCGFGAFPSDEQIVAVCTTHTAMHELFASTPDFSIPYVAANEPDLGEVGFEVDITATFDGWGYVRVLDTSTPVADGVGFPGFAEVSQISIPETADEEFATGFGDLTVHEVEVPRGDPNEGGPGLDDDLVAYFSWYAGGFRVFDISDPANPAELGHYIDAAGNNFWGVALAEDGDGNRIVLASDRDFGLFIFRYTGLLPE